jgi:hypothetical protein
MHEIQRASVTLTSEPVRLFAVVGGPSYSILKRGGVINADYSVEVSDNQAEMIIRECNRNRFDVQCDGHFRLVRTARVLARGAQFS